MRLKDNEMSNVKESLLSVETSIAATDYLRFVKTPGSDPHSSLITPAGLMQTPVQAGGYNYAIDTGAADALAITLSPAPTALTVGMKICTKVKAPNTSAATINVNALGAVAIKKKFNAALAAGDIVAGMMIELIYDGANWQLNSPVAN